jgi:hypothetical protein
MRTLVIGISLPNATFDNHSFLSAPSLADYHRLIVDMDAASKVVAEVAAGSVDHKTYTGLPIANGDSTTDAMGLADVLAMRRREAEWFLGQGGTICAYAHPDVAVKGVRKARDWRRYSWLPAPEGFSYADDLHASFGKAGVAAVEDHPFATYFERFGRTAGYRVRLNEAAGGFSDYATVFARSEGGAAIGAELRVLRGSVVLLPPLIRVDSDRSPLAQTLLECFERVPGEPESQQPVASEAS